MEASAAADRHRVFESAAWYTLTTEELQEIFDHSADEVVDYIKGIVTAGVRLWRYEAPEEERKVFQQDVFMLLVKNPLYQKHLALNPGERVQTQ